MDTRKPNKIGKKYSKYLKSKQGESENYNFFERVLAEDRVVEIREFFAVVENLFAYEIWDGYEVEKHLLIVPKKFTESISNFSPEERREYFEILADYDARGFSIYARDPKNLRKTVKHQHTHLIRLDFSKRVNWLFNISHKILWWR